MKTYIQLMEPSQLEAFKTNHTMEINPNHKLIISLNNLRKVDLPKANMIVRQLLDNTLLSCGLLLDPTDYVNKVIGLMETSIDHAIQAGSALNNKEAHRQVEGQENSAPGSSKDATLKEAYKMMQENLQNKVKTSAEVEIGPDGKPRVK